MQLSSNLRFCEYLIDRDIERWDALTPQIIMDFHIQDAHESAAGKNAYNSRIRQFLDFLSEHEHVPETLRLALPSSRIKEVSIVEVLSDEELTAIAAYKEKAEGPTELRSICIVLLGLRLGLRGTDIVNLKLSDICWQKQEIAVLQSKTAVALTLPMPTEVANCLYRYIVYSRPNTSSDAVFIRHRAPFCQLSRSACGASLSRVLGKSSEDTVGFHITRKTFASRLLASEVQVDTIVEVLGHTTNTTVHKYLATDEAGMRSCAIPIAAIFAGGVVMSA